MTLTLDDLEQEGSGAALQPTPDRPAIGSFGRVLIALIVCCLLATASYWLGRDSVSVAPETGPDPTAGPMDGWYSYDYAAGVHGATADNVMIRAKRGDDGSAWVSDAGWSVDTPETPDSVLALTRYDRWDLHNGVVVTTSQGGEDRRGDCAMFDLKGDQLDLHGGFADFWVMASNVGERWHTTTPLRIGDGTWASNTVRLGQESWRHSWTARRSPGTTATVDPVLADANSYGVGFVSFSETPTGRLGLRNFHFEKC